MHVNSESVAAFMVDESRRSVQSVERALTIVHLLADSGSGGTVSQLARQLGVHKSTASRLLATLENAGMVERDEATGIYRLGLDVVALSGTVLGRLEILHVADPVLRRLAETTQETVNFTIRYRDKVMNVQQIPGPNVLRSFDWVGKTALLHRGAGSKALLAYLPADELRAYLDSPLVAHLDGSRRHLEQELEEIRRTGFAVNRGEINPDVFAIGAPIFDGLGRCRASVSVAGSRTAFSDERIPELARQVMSTARTISQQLGHDVGGYAPLA
ncbi:MAG TPA: IclR family transcriptional regulator [Thermomicrobiaceae bacterium]|nr:IclR family transcriptional regulator [Thermomicrobiaceae bacterium]